MDFLGNAIRWPAIEVGTHSPWVVGALFLILAWLAAIHVSLNKSNLLSWQPLAVAGALTAFLALDAGLRSPGTGPSTHDNIQLGALSVVAVATAVTIGFTLVVINTVALEGSYVLSRALIASPYLWRFLAISIPTIVLALVQIAIAPTSETEEVFVVLAAVASFLFLLDYVISVPSELDPETLGKRLIGDSLTTSVSFRQWWRSDSVAALRHAIRTSLDAGRSPGLELGDLLFREMRSSVLRPPKRDWRRRVPSSLQTSSGHYVRQDLCRWLVSDLLYEGHPLRLPIRHRLTNYLAIMICMTNRLDELEAFAHARQPESPTWEDVHRRWSEFCEALKSSGAAGGPQLPAEMVGPLLGMIGELGEGSMDLGHTPPV